MATVHLTHKNLMRSTLQMPGVSQRLRYLVGLSAAVDDNLYSIVFEFAQQVLPERGSGGNDGDQMIPCTDLQAGGIGAEEQIVRLPARIFDNHQITGLNTARFIEWLERPFPIKRQRLTNLLDAACPPAAR